YLCMYLSLNALSKCWLLYYCDWHFSFCLSVANLMSIVILTRGRCGLSKSTSHYLLAMSTADLMVIITSVIFYRIIPAYFPSSFVSITPVCRLIMVLLTCTTAISVWLTVAFTFDRYLTICCQNQKIKYFSGKSSGTVVAVLSVFCVVISIPWGFIVEPQYIFNNIPWGCEPKTSFYTSISWEAFDTLNHILTPIFPFIMILDKNRGKSDSDPEMKNRKKSIVLLFAISTSFISLWMTYVLYSLYWRISNIYSFTDPLFITLHSGYMLQLLSSCTNTCVYAATQTKFREELSKFAILPLNTPS
uniref:G-protein coupled receptors family 1 profile domain-containing protein n=1 Tax=Callorhinchus milii TaxID=7868 RepID=A0A4W3GVW7_CALMI